MKRLTQEREARIRRDFNPNDYPFKDLFDEIYSLRLELTKERAELKKQIHSLEDRIKLAKQMYFDKD